MPLSQDILSLKPEAVHSALLEIYDEATAGIQNPAAKALMEGVARQIATANLNKDKKRQAGLVRSEKREKAKARQAAFFEQGSEHVVAAEMPSLTELTQEYAKQLTVNIFTPAYTAHPTDPKSSKVNNLLVAIYDLVMMIRNEAAAGEREPEIEARKTQTIAKKLKELESLGGNPVPQGADKTRLLALAEDNLKNFMRTLSTEKLQPETKLTVEEEVARNLQIFAVSFKQFNKTRHRVIEEFCQEHNIENPAQIAEISKILTPAIAKQFNIYFWSGSDADGNKNVTAQTMLAAVHKHQEFLDELYMSQVAEVQKLFPEGHPMRERLDKVLAVVALEEAAEAAGKVETVKGSERLVHGVAKFLEEDLLLDGLSEEQVRALEDLECSFKCFGFVGPRMDVRQSSVENTALTLGLLKFLQGEKCAGSDNFPVELFGDPEAYEKLGVDEQLRLCRYLSSSEVVQYVADRYSKFPAEYKTEVERMIVSRAYPDVFPRYIISDNKGIRSWEEVMVLVNLSNVIIAQRAREEGRDLPPEASPPAIFPLCERREDTVNLPEMIRELLASQESVAALGGVVRLFLGYSDMEKRCGIDALILMQLKLFETLQIIEKYNLEHPDHPLEVEIFNAPGGDLIRGGNKIDFAMTTYQGSAAFQHRSKQMLKARLSAMMSGEDGFDTQMQQWKALMENAELYTALIAITDTSIDQFEGLVVHGEGRGDEIANFLTQITVGSALSSTNVSSRAPAKGSPTKKLNLDSQRAIGSATLFQSCGLNCNVWFGLADVPEAQWQHLPALMERMTVVQDVVYKTMYALAITNFDLVRKGAEINDKEKDPDLLRIMEEMREKSFDALCNVLRFLPMESEERGHFMTQIMRKEETSDIGYVTLGIMEVLQDRFPVVKDLLNSAQTNRQVYQEPISQILDQYKESKPEKRVELDSQLAVLYRAQMDVPKAIDYLQSDTPLVLGDRPKTVAKSLSGSSLVLGADPREQGSLVSYA